MATQDEEERTASSYDTEQKRLIRYLKALDFLNKKESSSVKSILTMVNRFVIDPNQKRLKTHYELAEEMLEFGIYKKVIEFADQLIMDPEVHDSFLGLSREESGDVREAIIRDYMEPIPKYTVFPPDATLEDMIAFFRSANPEIRYFIVADDTSRVLMGIVSVNDFTRNLDAVKSTDRSTPVPDLPFFNGNPKVVLSTDKMEYAQNLFNEAQQAGKRITKLLVVDGSKRPVGFLAEPDLVRWETAVI